MDRNVTSLPVAGIRVGPRQRKDMGDLDALAESVRRTGLLAAILVDPAGTLVDGERRLRACRDILGWVEIPVRVVDVACMLVAERDANEVRKDYTPSERVNIAQAMNDEIGDRQGERTDLFDDKEQLQYRGTEVPPGVQTREIAAKKAGFDSYGEFRRARVVTRQAVPEVVEAMDRGDVTVTRAERIARLPKAEQPGALAEATRPRRGPGRPRKDAPAGENGAATGGKVPPAARATPPPVDRLGAPLPAALVPVFADQALFARALQSVKDLAGVLDALAHAPGGAALASLYGRRRKSGKYVYHSPHLKDLEITLRGAQPHAASCPACRGRHASTIACGYCEGRGWLSASAWRQWQADERKRETAKAEA